MENRYAKVYLLDNPYCIDNEFTYFVPHCLQSSITRGSFVIVPFGISNKRQVALVTDVTGDAPESKTKAILSLASEEVTFTDGDIELCDFMKEQTLCTVGDAVHAMIPAGALSEIVTCYRASEGATISEDDEYADVFFAIRERESATSDALRQKFASPVNDAIKALLDRGLIEKDVRIKTTAVGKEKKYFRLSVSNEQLSSLVGKGDALSGYAKLRSQKQIDILTLLSLRERASAEEIKTELSVTDAQLSALVGKGFISKESESVYRNPYENKSSVENRTELTLSDEQSAAFAELEALYDGGTPACALLHGVTGSGKTSVMMKLIDKALLSGKGAIMLIPEISLTPQTVDLFCSRYGSRVAIIHSSLSQGERLDAYMRIKRGEADLVIGTRSAIFAPVKDLGLIIIDEEQEHTYKSDNNPKYHARDIARFRCAKEGALLLLASATPSVESYKKACDGAYRLIELKHRYGKATLPEVKLADMRESLAAGNDSGFSMPLLQEIGKNIESGEQSILFLNRRGYHNFVSCASCGKAVYCPNCSVPMTHHTDRIYHASELVCHWCGSRRPMPRTCPECNSEHIKPMGFGTQFIEKKIGEIFPSARSIRMDTDTTSSKSSYENMLTDFRSHKADILLGTQMVTKGHDFPDVTLVGILNADASLYLNDFRAGEKTFSMLTQVIGRAGRSDKAGRALIQTTNPDNDVIRLACAQDYKTFYKNEIKTRRLLSFPPFCDIVLLTMTGPEESAVMRDIKKLSDDLKACATGEYRDVPLIFFGPFEAPVYKVDGKYRMRMIIKCKLNRRSRSMFAQIYRAYGKRKRQDPVLSIDFNPSSL